jgi:hypothetical protein
MYQVTAYGMAPMHVAPFALERVVLIEEVVFTLVEHQAVGVVVPSPFLGIMYLRAVVLAVQAVCPGDFVILINGCKSGPVFRIRDGDSLSFIAGHIQKNPIVRLVRSYPYIEGIILMSRSGEGHPAPSVSVRDREIQIPVTYLDLKVPG